MEENEIYTFLKKNELTTKSEEDFNSEYSTPEKANELHKFFTENNLTTKDSAAFYDTYFKKKVETKPSGQNAGSVSEGGGTPSGSNRQYTASDLQWSGGATKEKALETTEHAGTPVNQKVEAKKNEIVDFYNQNREFGTHDIRYEEPQDVSQKKTLALYSKYLAENEPEKLNYYSGKRKYLQEGGAVGSEPEAADLEKTDADFYKDALNFKQSAINLRMQQLDKQTEKVLLEHKAGIIPDEMLQQYDAQVKPEYEQLTKESQLNQVEAQNYVKQFPIEAANQLEKRALQAGADMRYEMNPIVKVNMAIGNQTGRAVADFAGKILRTPQTVTANDEYGITDRWADIGKDFSEEVNDMLFPEPSKFGKGLIENAKGIDGKELTDKDGDKIKEYNWDLLIPKATRTLADMGLLVGSSAATGGAAMSTIAAGYVLTASDLYESAIEAGMKPSDASKFSASTGIAVATAELINPEIKFLKQQIINSSIKNFAENLTKGVAYKEAVVQLGKETGKNILKENTQEHMQNTLQHVGEYTASELTGKEIDKGDLYNEAYETTVLTSIASGIFGVSGAAFKEGGNQLLKQSLWTAAQDPKVMRERLAKMVEQGVIEKEGAQRVGEVVDQLALNLDAVPGNINAQKQKDLVELLFQKMQIGEKANKEGLDENIKKVYDAQTAEIDVKIQKIVSPKAAEKKEPTFNEKLKAEVEKEEPVVDEPVVSKTTEEIVTSEAPVETTDISKQEIPTVEQDLNIGDKITVKISGKIEQGVVSDVGKHKGKIVVDFKDANGDERFAYGHQIEAIEKQTKKLNEQPQPAITTGEPTGDVVPIVEEQVETEGAGSKEITNPELQEFTLGYAPMREGDIKDLSNSDKSFENKKFKVWKKMATKFATDLGIKITSQEDAVGVYEQTSDNAEASNIVTVEGTKEQVRTLAAMMGALSPDVQNSVMILNYDKAGANTEHRVTFKTKEDAIKFAEERGNYGIKNISLLPGSNTVIVLDEGNFDTNKFSEDYGQSIADARERKTNAEFIQEDEYAGIVRQARDTLQGRDGGVSRQNLSDALSLAEKRADRRSGNVSAQPESKKVELANSVKNYVKKFKEKFGLSETPTPETKAKVVRETAKKIKQAYDKLASDNSANPDVKAAYEQLGKEIEAQYEYLTKELGIQVEFMENNPYDNSNHMMWDVYDNKHLKVFKGGEPHSFLGEQSADANGITLNEKFRAVHDYFGHAVEGNQFGENGEERAWEAHSRMFSPLAQKAMTTETRGQNSWVNNSKENKSAIAKFKKGNELIAEGKVSEGEAMVKEAQSEMKFAEQKVDLLPEEFTNTQSNEIQTSTDDGGDSESSQAKKEKTKTKPAKSKSGGEVSLKEGDEVRFVHIAGERTGKVISVGKGTYEVAAKNADPRRKDIIITVKEGDILQEGETFNDWVDKGVERAIDLVTPKTMKGVKKSGVGAEEVIRAAAAIIKAAHKAGTDIAKAIDDAVAYIKKNWDNAWGTFDEAGVRDIFALTTRPPGGTPPPTSNPAANQSPQERKISLNKFDKLFNVPEKKSETWNKIKDVLKNASNWLDNPFRFVTQITEQISKEYGTPLHDRIPLGRLFEKNSVGRAALATDNFIQTVIGGKIGNEDLGKLPKEHFKDFQLFLAARRVVDRLETEQAKKDAGEESTRTTGNITRTDAYAQLDELYKKYSPEVMLDFETRADAFQDEMDTMLRKLVDAGVISAETYDQIKKDNDFYAPFSVVQSKVYADQQDTPKGITNIVKKIKGISYDVNSDTGITMLDDLAKALNDGTITGEEYFTAALFVLDNARNNGTISNEEYEAKVASLENPGFALNGIIDAAANMIYRAEGMITKNGMLQRLYEYRNDDKEGLFIRKVDGFEPVYGKNGVTMRPKQLQSIKVDEGFAPIKLRVNGKDKIVAINKHAADQINGMNNLEVATWMKGVDIANKIFRTAVITLSPGFQAVNLVIDFVRASMLSRYGLLAGKGLAENVANLALYLPQYLEAFGNSLAGNLGYKTDVYKQWMASDSFSKGMFDNLFDNQQRVKEITSSKAKQLLMGALKLKFLEIPGQILEQTHKIAVDQRGRAVEGLSPKLFTAWLSSRINAEMKDNMTEQELGQAADKLNYEVQNYAGSPNFPQTHKTIKIASVFLQFFSARLKGEMTDYRRVSNLLTGRGEGVNMTASERGKLMLQFGSVAAAIAYYALKNNMDDDDEKEFDTVQSYHQDNYLNIPLGTFEHEGETHRDFAKVPLRGLTATMNVMANKFVKFWKRENPEEFKKAAVAFIGNASPVNLHGRDEGEYGESLFSNTTPLFKFGVEHSFNKDTHNHRELIPRKMLSLYRDKQLKPYEVKTDKTPEWATEMSKYMYDNMGVEITPITLDHMENTMGNPTEMYNKAIKKRLIRSEAKYPVALPPKQ